MRIPALDSLLWAAGPSLNVALLCTLVFRRRLSQFPLLAAWATFTLISTVVGLSIYRLASHSVYARVYWLTEAVDALLQLLVIAEVFLIVYRPVIRSRKMQLLVIAASVAAMGVSLVMAFAIHPRAASTTGILEIRGQLFTSLLVCIVFTLVLLSSQRMGLYWRSHVMSVGYGLTVWSVVCLLLDLLHGYWGRSSHFLELEHIRMVVYLAVFAFWSIALWREEPKRKPVTPEMQAALLHISEKVSYDLAKALGTRGKEFR